jgi:Ca2+-binding RTX toxin-like protein
MTQVLSNSFIDFRMFNGAQLLSGFNRTQFLNNLNVSIDASEMPGVIGTYTAPDLFAFWSGSSTFETATQRLAVAGDFTLDANNNATSGTVSGFVLTNNVAEFSEYFAILGFSYSAVAFQQVMTTASNTDDIAMLKAILSGADTISGSAFSDFAWGWSGNDKLFGNGGNDTLAGDNGNDQLRGGTGNDQLRGGNGADTLLGDAGNDRLYDGLGTDRLSGGSGNDFFYFSMNNIENDRVTDFADGADRLYFDVAAGSPLTVSAVLADAVDITGGLRFTLDDGDVLTIMGITKAQLADQIFLY